MKEITVSESTLRRLPKYLHYLRPCRQEGRVNTSASEISRELGIHHTQVRKDLAVTGVRGMPKVGHRIDEIIKAIESFLNWNNTNEAFLVGVGNLGKALLRYNGFKQTNIKIVAAFDADKRTISKIINNIEVLSVQKLGSLTKRMHVHIGIIATPSEAAQEVATVMTKSGIKAIWNFTPIKLNVPEDVIVENAEIYSSLAVLSGKLAKKMKG